MHLVLACEGCLLWLATELNRTISEWAGQGVGAAFTLWWQRQTAACALRNVSALPFLPDGAVAAVAVAAASLPLLLAQLAPYYAYLGNSSCYSHYLRIWRHLAFLRLAAIPSVSPGVSLVYASLCLSWVSCLMVT